MRRFYLGCLFLLMWSFPLHGEDRIRFYHMGEGSELAQVTVNGLYQDEYGVLWIGTRNGVKKYNGNRFETVTFPVISKTVFPAQYVICGDKKGHVYINADYRVIEYDLRSEQSRVIFSQSNSHIPPVTTLSYGKSGLWVSMRDSLLLYRDSVMHKYAVLPDCEISYILESDDGNLYAGTRECGLYRIGRTGEKTRILNPGSEIITLFEDNRRNIWVGTFNNGLFRISSDGTVTNYLSGAPGGICNNYVRSVCQDDQGNIWVGTMRGLCVIDALTGRITSYGLAEEGRTGLSNLSVWVIMKDNMGTMWIGTFYGGLNYCNPITGIFSYINVMPPSRSGQPIIGKVVEDRQGNFWIGTEGNGLIYFDRKTERHHYYVQGEGSVSHDNIKSLCYDGDDDLWIGTHLGGLCRYDIAGKKFTHYTINPDDKTKYSEVVHGLALHGDTLFVGALTCVYTLDIKSGRIGKVAPLDSTFFEVRDILIDRNENLWIAGDKLCRYSIRTGKTDFFEQELSHIAPAEHIFSTSLHEDAQGRIVIGTFGCGVLHYDPERNYFDVYNSKNVRLASDFITAVGEMRDGYLLAGNNTGFSCINAVQGKSYNFDAHSGFPLHSMLPGCIMHASDGRMILGGMDGIAAFDDNALFSITLPVKLYFSQLWINNQEIRVRDQTGILSSSLVDTKRIKLRYNQNNISIDVGNDNFINFGQPEYQCKLEGFDKEWVPFSPGAQIRYMNLPHGKYTLRVRAILFSDNSEENEISLEVVITPPLYLTWYAYLFYGLLLGAVVYFFRSRLLLRTSLELERREKLQQEQINESKQRFFANMSHELRTPLTLITGQLELLFMTGRLSGSVHKRLVEIHGSAGKMSKLVNELLDFLKYDKGMFRLKVQKCDIVKLAREVYDSFSALAQLKGVDFVFHSDAAQLDVWLDPSQIQKVFNNLLSNAFKYTNTEKGQISVEVRTADGMVRILIRDNGIGVPEGMREKIFERFVQADNNRDWLQPGTGIGLSLTQNILAAHHGSIRVESRPGQGSLFIVELKTGDEVFCGDSQVDVACEDDSKPGLPYIGVDDREFLEKLTEQQQQVFPRPCTLLIVEDDECLRRMLVQIFETMFVIYEADNGEDGFDTAVRQSPDLIISDVMMPGISGGELCRKIKNNFDTCHIPVVLLTALAGVEHRIEGLNCGADDYVAKPFNVRLLVTRCVTLLNNRHILQNKFSTREESLPQTVTTNTLDQRFIEEVIRVVEENIEDGNIDVGILCEKMGVSRSKMFLKMKGIMGQTPHEFIQNIKLKVAAKMLRENFEMNISDVAYYLGFSSLNYFGKYFRTYFGSSPSAYRKQYASGKVPPADPQPDGG